MKVRIFKGRLEDKFWKVNEKLDEIKFSELVKRLNSGEALKLVSNFDALPYFALSFDSLQHVTCAQYLHSCTNENHFNRVFHDHARVQWKTESLVIQNTSAQPTT